jgi:MFS family permease
MAPALNDISKELHFTSELQLIFSLSVFLLGTAVVPLLTAPLSEVFGRSLTLQTMNVFYIIFNTLCGIAKTPGQLIAYRFLAGLGGAGPFAVCSLQMHHAMLTDSHCEDWQWYQCRPLQAP